MSVKNKVMSFLIFTTGLLSGGEAKAQNETASDSAKDSVEIPVKKAEKPAYKRTPKPYSAEVWHNRKTPQDETQSATDLVEWPQYESSEQNSEQNEKKIPWHETEEGKEFIETYMHAMDKIGEHPVIEPSDIIYLRALSTFNREVAMLDGTGYTFDKDDLQGITPDSLQNKLADDTTNWLTPAAYEGASCNHAVKGNLFSNGLLLSAVGISPACDMEKCYRDDINFVGFEINPSDDCYAVNGTTKVYRKSHGHPYGHIGIAISTGNTETSKDSSDKLRNNINENNYSGIVCFFTAHSTASLETCLAAWGTKYKNDNRPKAITAESKTSEFCVNLRPKQVFEAAVSCKEQYFENYNMALNNMPSNYKLQDGYIVGPSMKIPLIARNAKRAKPQAAKRRAQATVRRPAVRQR